MSQLYDDAFAYALNSFQSYLAGRFKELFESKHLYQSVFLDWSPLRQDAMKMVAFPRQLIHEQSQAEAQIAYFVNAPWRVGPSRDLRPMSSLSEKQLYELWCTLPTMKLFCKSCDRIEAFNPSYVEDAIDWMLDKPGYTSSTENVVQVFIVSVLCQSCKKQPEIFLVRRQKDKLTLVGRSIMEVVQVPRSIPKGESKYFSGSIVAFQSGQVLAGLFLLRTFIEQFARSGAKNKEASAEELIDEYMAALPEDFNRRFPSLRKVYGDLSFAIHQAEESEVLYNECRDKLELHFNAREVFAATANKA